MWLHLTPMRHCLDVTTWEASLWCRLLRAYLSLFCFVWWYIYQACLCHPLALYASLHTCLHVHAWVLLASVSSILQHNEVMDIWSKPTFVPRGHHLLFAILLVYPFARMFALIRHAMLVISISLVCIASFCYYFHIFLPLLICWFSCLCLCMYTHGARTHGPRAWSPRRKQKGHECKHANMSWVAAVSRFRGLAFPFGYVLF